MNTHFRGLLGDIRDIVTARRSHDSRFNQYMDQDPDLHSVMSTITAPLQLLVLMSFFLYTSAAQALFAVLCLSVLVVEWAGECSEGRLAVWLLGCVVLDAVICICRGTLYWEMSGWYRRYYDSQEEFEAQQDSIVNDILESVGDEGGMAGVAAGAVEGKLADAVREGDEGLDAAIDMLETQTAWGEDAALLWDRLWRGRVFGLLFLLAPVYLGWGLWGLGVMYDVELGGKEYEDFECELYTRNLCQLSAALFILFFFYHLWCCLIWLTRLEILQGPLARWVRSTAVDIDSKFGGFPIAAFVVEGFLLRDQDTFHRFKRNKFARKKAELAKKKRMLEHELSIVASNLKIIQAAEEEHQNAGTGTGGEQAAGTGGIPPVPMPVLQRHSYRRTASMLTTAGKPT
jgi:hypothetical protein